MFIAGQPLGVTRQQRLQPWVLDFSLRLAQELPGKLEPMPLPSHDQADVVPWCC